MGRQVVASNTDAQRKVAVLVKDLEAPGLFHLAVRDLRAEALRNHVRYLVAVENALHAPEPVLEPSKHVPRRRGL
jgi:hypothetical protein